MSYEVFISYSSDDKKAADAVCHGLEQQDVRCWIAPRDILPGTEWGAAIVDAIDTVKIMVLLFSSSSNRSPQVRREIERAVSKGVILLPFRIEEVFPCKTLEYFLGTQHWLDAFKEPMPIHVKVLVRTVKTILASANDEDILLAANTEASAPQETILQPETVITANTFSADELAYIQVHLAEYIGPMAKILVSRASKKADSVRQLTTMLAEEIAAESERAEFLQAVESI